MKSSRFNFTTTYPATGEVLLFNTLTGAFLALENSVAARVEHLLKQPDAVPCDLDLADYLLRQGFLIDDDIDEHSVVLERNQLGIADPNRLDVIVMPNMNCNLACTYCYETHSKSQMDDLVAAGLVSWARVMFPKFKVVLLSWFGGEPLLSVGRVIQLQRELRQLAAESSTEFASHITTNGYLLDPQVAASLVDLDLFSYQITIDGARDIHDRMRPRRGGAGSFERIFRNVCALARIDDRVNIKLRVNYDDTNLGYIPDLLKEFPADVRTKLNLVLERIFAREYSNYADRMPARRVGVEIEELYARAQDMGFRVTTNPLAPDRLTYCYADRKSQFVVNFNGDVFKCTVDRFESKDRLGKLGADGTIAWDDARIASWHSVDAFESKCFDCVFMPMCMGGCRKVRGNFGTVGDDCKLPFAGFDRRLQVRYSRDSAVQLSENFPAGDRET